MDPHEVVRALGNLGIQRLLKAVTPRESSKTPTKGAAAAEKKAGVSEQPTQAAAPVAADGGVRPAATGRGGVAAAVPGDTADMPAGAAPRTAWGDPQSDPAYQAVAKKLGTNASRLKTPVKDAEEKKGEVRNAAELSPTRQQEKRGHEQQMTDLAAAPLPQIADFTVDAFMEAFERGFQELAKQLPKASENNRAVSSAVNFSAEKAVAVGEMKSQRDTKSQALSETAARNPMDSPAAKATPPATPELTRDPTGPLPAIPQAAAAAPKPVPSENISLDDQSKALDDALTNQSAGGQVLNIREASLALPVSGEKTFDEAGEAKRKAQEFIRRLIPGYRAVEAPALKKAGHKAEDFVGTGLQDFHSARNESFGGVLTHQQHHEKTVEDQKDAVLTQFEGIYNAKKELVDKELAALNGVGDDFEQALTKAEGELKKWVRNNLEYIYTPGMFDYSDWIDKRKPAVKEEYDRLKRKGTDELDWVVWARALKTIQDKDAQVLFDEAKDIFLRNVTAGARTIAVTIVDTLNRAKNHIVDGQQETQKIYNSLGATEKTEYENAYLAVQGRYTTLAESVADRHREIVADMARSYHKVAGTLQATFEAIRKDVLTSWWQKAWNKIKAVVGAIVEFATRIAQLLGKMLHLLGDIISSPRYFFNNLVTGIGRGLSTFVERIDDFLAEAFFDWLRGSTGVTVQLPKDWDPKGIFGLFTQLLGLSTETIWQRMEVVYDKTIANVFRRGEAVVEKGLELFEIVRKDGLGGLWTYIKESLGTILTDTLESMKETILYAAIKKVMIEVGKLLIPGGGFIAIAEKVIRLLVFIVEARNKILNLIQSFVESMENAVNGDVSGIVSKITGALKTFITVALDFLVSFFGLGGLKSKVERVIERMRSPIIRGIDWVLGKAKPLVMRIVAAGKAVIQAGLPQDPNERLKLGMRAAVASADRFAGKRVGALVLSPLLAGIKLRYGFTSLDVLARGANWAIRGQVNPEAIEFTRVVVGTDEDTGTEFTKTVVDPPKVLVFEFRRFTENQNVGIVEMTEGLQHHQEALNALTVDQWLANIHFRPFLKGAVAAEERDVARKEMIEELKQQILAEYTARGVTLTGSQLYVLIKQRARKQHASHDADAIAGGNIDDFAGLERGAVNSYVGSNWGKFRDVLEDYARELKGQIGPADRGKVYMNFRLRIKFLN